MVVICNVLMVVNTIPLINELPFYVLNEYFINYYYYLFCFKITI